MDNVVNLFYGGSVQEDEFWNVSFVGMQMVPVDAKVDLQTQRANTLFKR